MAGFSDRKLLYQEIERRRQSKVIAYVTGDRLGLETQIGSDVYDLFVEHLDPMFPVARLTLILYTKGGDTSVAWSLVNLLRMFCEELEVLVLTKALSAGTLICLGADRIIMTKQAMLGPIDPSIANHPLAPSVGSSHSPMPVSVEAIRGYLDLVRQELRIKSKRQLTDIQLSLAEKIHPLLLGDVFRRSGQIRYIAEKLLKAQIQKRRDRRRIIKFLVSDSGSHDYTINRREAEELGLEIEKPGTELYGVIKALYNSFKRQLDLDVPFRLEDYFHKVPESGKPDNLCFFRGLIESLPDRAHAFVTIIELRRLAGTDGTLQFQHRIVQERWDEEKNYEFGS